MNLIVTFLYRCLSSSKKGLKNQVWTGIWTLAFVILVQCSTSWDIRLTGSRWLWVDYKPIDVEIGDANTRICIWNVVWNEWIWLSYWYRCLSLLALTISLETYWNIPTGAPLPWGVISCTAGPPTPLTGPASPAMKHTHYKKKPFKQEIKGLLSPKFGIKPVVQGQITTGRRLQSWCLIELVDPFIITTVRIPQMFKMSDWVSPLSERALALGERHLH